MRSIMLSLTAGPALAALAAGSLLSPVVAGPSAGDPAARPVVHGLTSPLSLAVTDDGTVYVSQNFAGLLMRRLPGKKAQVIASVAKGGEAGAVSVRGGAVTYAVSRGHNEVGKIRRIDAQGRDRGVADLGKHERRSNPDGDVTYGFRGISKSCAAKLPKQVGPATYTGSVETHPYATTSAPGVTYVADAGANAVLAISGHKVSTVAVIPPAVTEITKARAKANGLPGCTVGLDYRFESVPTDVEIGPGGQLYVSSLPGGPEDGSVGRLGAVYVVDPASGTTERLARGLVSATGLAVDPGGDVYVSELFKNRISRIADGSSKAKTWRKVTMPGDLEISGGRLWATTDVLKGTGPGQRPGGKVRSFPLG
ncbi:NHL repeat protein [Nocardioides dokdonensis FR1436]|uniref:NHL repeat protein n=1 Tax=Nocardioides dokdonensis FR1436 TaxID=1300347 RepID=A0A1A9GG81_9ACTN|nr:ScyD/ScyE family protein [Nocardioides dokdonensis]ANH36700.1 NHL repeat protein [Nocardioides dokdonensis FR1436]